jgi:hypothetical protein
VLHGLDGEHIRTTWGYYRMQGKFHAPWITYEALRMRCDGNTLLCNDCFKWERQPIKKGATQRSIRCRTCGQLRPKRTMCHGP